MGNKNSNLIGRYVWLVDKLQQKGHLSYKEISDQWEISGLSNKEPLPWRTFQNHREAIADIFQINIDCKRQGGYKYYIENPEDLKKDKLRSWLIRSYATLNQLQADKSLEGRIIFEQIPSGDQWLTTITDAMRHNKVLCITHKGFSKPEAITVEIEPYCLKVVKRRWYVIARSPYYSICNKQKNLEQGNNDKPEDVYLIYALDRMQEVTETDKTFNLNSSFSIDKFFEGCVGIIPSEDKTERVVIKAYFQAPEYLRTLPIHESQFELPSDNPEYSLFEYHVKPTFDFYMTILSQADQLEVLEPASVRSEIKNFLTKMSSYYNK